MRSDDVPSANVYLAGPFFNSEQKKALHKIKAELLFCGFSVCDPQELSPVIVEMDESERTEDRLSEIFRKNVVGIRKADCVLAWIDERDTGTSFEIGYAFGVGIPVYTISLTGKAANVMLSHAVHGHLDSISGLGLLSPGKRISGPGPSNE